MSAGRPAPLVVVQARMSSSRLPGKVLAELAGGVTALGLQLERLADCREVAGVVVATSDRPEDDGIAELARASRTGIVRGSLHDVLDRFALVLERFAPAGVVRLTADCPVIDPAVVDTVARRWREGSEDYVANVLPPRTFPVGMDTEVVTGTALRAADAEASDPYDREHVTPFIRENLERFPAASVTLGAPRPDVRLVLDTAADLERLRAVVARAGRRALLADLVAAYDALDEAPG